MAAAPIILVTRGSALALAQTHLILAQCKAEFPEEQFQIKILKTTGDKLQMASLASANLPKGLFTKELESALLNREADIAVHSLKDLPTEIPAGLRLGAVSKREDPRDVLIYKGRTARQSVPTVGSLPEGATVATSSTRRQAFLLERRPDLKIVPIRGNVPTRLKRLMERKEIDAMVLAAAGVNRLGYKIQSDGALTGEGVPAGLMATPISPDEMLPCVGQAAIGLEIRIDDSRMTKICDRLNDQPTYQCILAERALLRGLGGGCQVPVGAFAETEKSELHLRAISFMGKTLRRGKLSGPPEKAEEIGQRLAAQLLSPESGRAG